MYGILAPKSYYKLLDNFLMPVLYTHTLAIYIYIFLNKKYLFVFFLISLISSIPCMFSSLVSFAVYKKKTQLIILIIIKRNESINANK